MTRNRRTALRIVVGGVTMGALATALFAVAGLHVNITPSIPLGLYIRTQQPIARGVLVELCPVDMARGESTRYRGFGLACPDYALPLLKPVVAIGGDRVDVRPDGLAVNGELLPNTKPLAYDRRGLPLRAWPVGTYVVGLDEVVVASTYHPGSYDSRYLGPIPRSRLLGALAPVLTRHRTSPHHDMGHAGSTHATSEDLPRGSSTRP